MKIAILHGTPKKELSQSNEYIEYFKRCFPECECTILPVGVEINKITNDSKHFNSILTTIKQADGVFWVIPVYYGLVPCQVKRFIEKVTEQGAASLFKDKYTAVMTTSIQYLDHTAVAYLHGICDDWQMRFVDWFSATVYIPLNQEKLKNVHTFFNQFVNSIRNQTATVTTYPQLPTLEHKYIDSHVKSVPHSGNRKIVLLTDSTSSNPSLENMIKTFEHFLANPVERIDLASYKLGDCLGCLNCSFNNTCVHKDDFRDLFEQHIIKADAIVFAGQIVDRFLSSKMKLFLDRSFYYNHIPVLKGKQMGLLVSGPVSMAPQIIEVYRAFSEMHQAHLGGFVSDERKQASTTTSALQIFANQLVQNIDVNYIKPQTFLGIGGSKIFRDFSYMLRYPFVAEYKHFKKTLYDSFPQNRKKVIFKSSLLYWLAHLKKDRRTVMKLSRQKGLSVFRDSFDNPN